MNTEVQTNVGAASEAAVVAQNELSFAAKAKKVAAKAKEVAGKVQKAAEKAAYPVLATAVVTSSVVCAAYRVIKLVRLIRGDEK